MGTIRIRIGHDDNLVIVGIFDRKVSPDSSTDGVDHGVDFLVFEDVTHIGLFGIKNLPSKRKDSLELTVPTLLSRSTG